MTEHFRSVDSDLVFGSTISTYCKFRAWPLSPDLKYHYWRISKCTKISVLTESVCIQTKHSMENFCSTYFQVSSMWWLNYYLQCIGWTRDSCATLDVAVIVHWKPQSQISQKDAYWNKWLCNSFFNFIEVVGGISFKGASLRYSMIAIAIQYIYE